MNLITLLGSGVSIPSGLPTVKKITESVLSDEYHMHTDSTFYKGKGQSFSGDFEKTVRIQGFLKTLKKEIDANNNLRESNYEDLFYVCNQIYEHSLGEFENPLIVPFLSEFQRKYATLFETITVMGNMEFDFDYRILSDFSLSFIQCVVWDSLSFNNEPIGFELLIDILKSDKFKHNYLVTLNHDLLLEILLHKQKLTYNDGFTNADGDVYYFDSTAFKSSKDKIQLIKLHGSLDWFRFSSYDDGRQRIQHAKALNNDRWHCRNGEGELLANIDGIPRFLTGTNNKILDYTSDFYKILQNKFTEILSQNNTILISGYGWNDVGVNRLLFSWIDSKPENTIILLHKAPKELRANSKSALIYRFDELVKLGKLILIEKWLCECDLNNLLNVKPNLFRS